MNSISVVIIKYNLVFCTEASQTFIIFYTIANTITVVDDCLVTCSPTNFRQLNLYKIGALVSGRDEK
jgi:hypothetical protein